MNSEKHSTTISTNMKVKCENWEKKGNFIFKTDMKVKCENWEEKVILFLKQHESGE